MRSIRFISGASGYAFALVATGCGGGAPPAATPSSPPPPVVATPAAAVDHSASAGEDEPKPPDPNESAERIVLAPLFNKKNPPKFPKSTVSDHDCWQDVELSGEAQKDYDALVGRCGAPTGLVKYSEPQVGHLHHKHDARDEFKLKLEGGYCYRYFAVADASISDLDILVTRYGGDIVGDDQVKGPVAIIQGSKPWCMDEDADYDFEVRVDGEGSGNYVIGAWARPK
jgi:hypothetical protein